MTACEICSTEFEPHLSTQKYCSPKCNSVAQNRKQRANPAVKQCRTCKEDLPEDRFRLRRRSCIACEDLISSGRKRCHGCREIKPLSEFYKRPAREHRNDTYDAQCKTCSSIKSQRRNASPDQKRDRRNRLMARYGITVREFDRMISDQGGVCAICKEPMTKPCVDHCHTTGRVRGLLCSPCNTLIGMSRDNVIVLKSAITYLEER